MPKFHDIGYKKLFSNPVYLEELLTSFVDEDFIKGLDFSSLQRLEKSFITDDFKEKESDLIYKINFKKKPIYIFLLLEFQSTVDPFMALRFLRYICEFYQSLISAKSVKKLPAVFPLLLYNGDAKWTAPVNINELIDSSISSKYIPNFQYYKIAENEFSKELLESIQNVVSALFYVENTDPKKVISALENLRKYLKKEPKPILRLFTKWLNHYLKYHDVISPDNLVELIIEDKEIKPMLETAMKRHDEEQQQIGIQRGELQDKQTILIRLMDKKFGLTSVEKTTILKCKNRDLLDNALEEILFAETKEIVLTLLK
ncbi:MAG: Rpn family recombination-promoting nuclease/putative transposase [Spirochaetales bacterium]|nr:Rpn family recombination-promoting nuclease/putative transposase [Spirochaetales bacterium]